MPGKTYNKPTRSASEKITSFLTISEGTLFHRFACSGFLRLGTLIVVCLFIPLTIFVLLKLTPMMADDFCFPYYSGERMTSLADVFGNIRRMYMSWDGRAPITLTTFLFSFLGKDAFDRFQPFLYLGIMILAYFHAFGRKKLSALPLLLIFLLSYLYSSAFGQAVLWLVGSCYSFACFCALLFLLPYRLAAEPQAEHQERVSPKKPWVEILLTPFVLLMAIYVGWIGANLAAGVLLIVTLFLFYYKKNHVSIRPWMILGLLGIVIGIAIMFAAPGNAVRIACNTEGTPKISFLHQKLVIFYQLAVLLETSSAIKLLAITFFAGSIKVAFFNSRGTSILLPCVYLIGGLSVIYSLLAAPGTPAPRSVYPASILLIIAAAAVVNSLGLDWKNRPNTIVLTTVLLIFGAMFSIKYVTDARECLSIKRVWNERIAIIHKALASGQKDVTLPSLPPPSRDRLRLLDVYDLFDETVAHYYHLDNVNVVVGKTKIPAKTPSPSAGTLTPGIIRADNHNIEVSPQKNGLQ